MYRLFETIRIANGQPKNISYHQSRMDAAFIAYFRQSPNISLNEVIACPDELGNATVKCRIVYDPLGFAVAYSVYEYKWHSFPGVCPFL